MGRNSPVYSGLIILLLCSCQQTDATKDGTNNKQDSVRKDSGIVDSVHVASAVENVVVYDFSSFIPKHYEILDSACGDLNLDPYPDAIIVLHHDDEEWMDERERPVLLLLGDSSGHYTLALRHDHLTPPKIEGQMFGEPFAGIEIDSGKFRVNHYGGSRFRWTCDYVFEYDKEKQTWFYVKNYGSICDMLGEMNDMDSLGQCMPYDTASLVIKPKVSIRKFDCASAPIAELEY